MSTLTQEEKNRLFQIHKDLPSIMVRKFGNYKNVEKEDMIQEATIGMIEALDLFDKDLHQYDPFEHERAFGSYAIARMRHRIVEFAIKNMNIVKIATTKNQRKLFFNLRKEKSDWNTWFTKEEVTALAEKYEVNEADILTMELRLSPMKGDFHYMSSSAINDSTDGDLNFDYNDFIVSDESVEDNCIMEEQKSMIRDLIKNEIDKFDERRKEIIMERFFKDEPTTLVELGKRYNVSTERVRQLEKDCLTKLRDSCLQEHK